MAVSPRATYFTLSHLSSVCNNVRSREQAGNSAVSGDNRRYFLLRRSRRKPPSLPAYRRLRPWTSGLPDAALLRQLLRLRSHLREKALYVTLVSSVGCFLDSGSGFPRPIGNPKYYAMLVRK